MLTANDFEKQKFNAMQVQSNIINNVLIVVNGFTDCYKYTGQAWEFI